MEGCDRVVVYVMRSMSVSTFGHVIIHEVVESFPSHVTVDHVPSQRFGPKWTLRARSGSSERRFGLPKPVVKPITKYEGFGHLNNVDRVPTPGVFAVRERDHEKRSSLTLLLLSTSNATSETNSARLTGRYIATKRPQISM